MRLLAAILASACASACAGNEGTIGVELVTAPGSTLLDGVQTLRFTITAPDTTTIVERTAAGFDVSLDLPADGGPRAIEIAGLDAAGTIVAVGQSPAFPVAAITARVVIYLAPPMSLAAAPHDLAPARAAIAVAPLTYGAILVGGADAALAASADVGIYNAYDHSLVDVLPLPAARAHPCLGVTRANDVYVFGGRTTGVDGGATAGQLWKLSTATPPMGAYATLGDQPAYARDCELGQPARTNVDQFVVGGTPALAIGGNVIAARTDLPSLPPTGASVTATDGTISAIFRGPAGYTRFRDDVVDTLPAVATSDDVRLVANPGDHTILVVEPQGLLRIDPIAFTVTPLGTTSLARVRPAVAATARHVLVAGGATADVFDAVTLARVATIPLVVPRSGAAAIALPNDQILVVGGVDADGVPVPTIELFTPPLPDR